MKGICHIWSRGRLISPSLPVGDDWYLNLNSQKRSPGRNLGEHRSVRRSGTASRGTVVLAICLHMRSFTRTSSLDVLTIFQRKDIRSVWTEHETLIMDLFLCVHIPVVFKLETILGDPGAVSWVDKMSVVKVYFKIEASPWALTLIEPVPEAVPIRSGQFNRFWKPLLELAR